MASLKDTIDPEAAAAAAAVEKEIADMINKRPLIGEREDGFASLAEEVAGTAGFQGKLPSLEAKYAGIRRVRGDGNCFYRSFTFRLFEVMLANEAERDRFVALAKTSLAYLLEVQYDQVSIETFVDYAVEAVEGLASKTHADVEALFDDAGESDYLVWYSRLVCAGYMKHEADKFMPFLTGAFPDVETFCAKEVEPMGKEADEPMIIALCDYLGVHVRVEYMDASESPETSTHHFHEAADGGPPAVCLLYRPGHYDILYPRDPT